MTLKTTIVTSGFLAVGTPHELYWEVTGAPDGQPVVLLHGGPGYGSEPRDRTHFDPSKWRIVSFDQRGSGKSRPLGELSNNSIDLLIADIDTLRRHLGIERWCVAGGSWGATLALAYATAYPDHCQGLILRSVFLGRVTDVEWFLSGASRFWPEVASRLRAVAGGGGVEATLASLEEAITHPNLDSRQTALLTLLEYNDAVGSYAAIPDTLPQMGFRAEAFVRIQVKILRELVARQFGEHLLTRLMRLPEVPVAIVHGRMDTATPPAAAFLLKEHFTDLELRLVHYGGHSAFDPGMAAAFADATTSMLGRLNR